MPTIMYIVDEADPSSPPVKAGDAPVTEVGAAVVKATAGAPEVVLVVVARVGAAVVKAVAGGEDDVLTVGASDSHTYVFIPYPHEPVRYPPIDAAHPPFTTALCEPQLLHCRVAPEQPVAYSPRPHGAHVHRKVVFLVVTVPRVNPECAIVPKTFVVYGGIVKTVAGTGLFASFT